MPEEKKTIITLEIKHGNPPSVDLTEVDKKDLANGLVLEHIGEYDWFGDWPEYKVTIDGEEIGTYNRENEYAPFTKKSPGPKQEEADVSSE